MLCVSILFLPTITVGNVVACHLTKLLLEYDLPFLSYDLTIRFKDWRHDMKLRWIFLSRTILSVFWRSVTKIAMAAETKEPSLGSTKMTPPALIRLLRLRLASLDIDSPASLLL